MANISHLPRTIASVPTPELGYITVFTDSEDLRPKYINSSRQIFDYTGPRGFAGTISIGTVTTVASNIPADVDNVGTPEDAIFDFVIPRGRSIVSITRTLGDGSEGTTDTYTITYDDSTTDTFSVYNGANGRSITNIQRTSGNGAPGTTDTYTITYSKAPLTSTFTVYNGANGTGTPTTTAASPVGDSGSAGTPGPEYANPDHVHAHGNQTNGNHHAVATTSVNGFMSSTDKTKLDGIAPGAEVNQNAFSSVTGNTGTATADGKTDTLAITGGTGISTTATDTPDGLVINNTGVTQFNGRTGNITPQQTDYDAFFTTPTEAANAAPVQSVNGQTGNVTITLPTAANAAPPPVSSNSSTGTTTGEYALEDHTHAGVTSISVNGGAAQQGVVSIQTGKNFTTTTNLTAATPATITHNLALTNKDTFTIRTAISSGQDIQLKVISVNTNSLTIESAVALTGVIVVVIGF